MVGDTEQVYAEQRVLVCIYWFDIAEVQALHRLAVCSSFFISSTISSSTAP